MSQFNHVHHELYRKLRIEIAKKNPDLNTVTYLTGLIHGFRMNGFQVPEIEDCFLFIEKHTGRDMLCL